MLVANDVGVAEFYAGVNAGVAVGVQQDDIARARQGGAHAHGGGVTGGKNDGVANRVKLGDFLLQRLVFRKRAVGQARTGGAGAPPGGGGLGCGDAARIKGQAHVIIGTGQDDPAPLDHPFGGRQDLLGNGAERHHFALGEFGLEIGHRLEFVKQHGGALLYW